MVETRKDVAVGKTYDYLWKDGNFVARYTVLKIDDKGYDIVFSNGAFSRVLFGSRMNLISTEILPQDARCDKCLHWKETDESEANVVGFKKCSALTSERTRVRDGSEYKADLVTGPDFFCAKFELLEETE